MPRIITCARNPLGGHIAIIGWLSFPGKHTSLLPSASYRTFGGHALQPEAWHANNPLVLAWVSWGGRHPGQNSEPGASGDDPSDRNQTEGARGASELMDPHDRHRGKLNSCTPPSFHHGLHVSKSDLAGPRSDSRSPKSPAEAGSGAMPIEVAAPPTLSCTRGPPLATGCWVRPNQPCILSLGPAGYVSSRKTVLRKSVHLWAAAALALVFQG